MPAVILRRAGPTRASRLIRIVLAVVLLLILGSLVLRSGLFAKRTDGIPEGYVRLPLASGAIAPLTRVEPINLQFGIFKKDLVSPDWITDPQQIVGRIALAGIADKSPFRSSILSPRGDELAGTIRTGWVAVTLELNQLEAPLELLAPGTLVAVLAEKETDAKGARVAVICSRALILTPPPSQAQQTPNAPGLGGVSGSRRPSPGQGGVTIQIPADDAVRLVQAQKAGRIHLALLSSTPGDFLNPIPPESVEAQAPIEIIRGTKRAPDHGGEEKPKRPPQPEKE
jgi:Flp pilus assembly protein CpaB